MHRLTREALALHFRALVNIERSKIFGTADADYRPINLPEDSATMFAGFVGPNCESGSCLILAINPGGGGDAYTERTNADSTACRAAIPRDAGPAFHGMPGLTCWVIFGPFDS